MPRRFLLPFVASALILGTHSVGIMRAQTAAETEAALSIVRSGPQGRYVIPDMARKPAPGLTPFSIGGLAPGQGLVIFEESEAGRPKVTSNFRILDPLTGEKEITFADLDDGTVVRLLGKIPVDLCHCIIEGGRNDPLSLVWVGRFGLVYVSGKGTVQLRDGKTVQLPEGSGVAQLGSIHAVTGPASEAVSIEGPSMKKTAVKPTAQKNWTDRAEYDLVASITQESAARRLELLNAWKQRYPTTDYEDMRLQLYASAYQALNRGPELLATAKEMVAADPQNMVGLYWVATFTLSNSSPEQLNAGQRAAQGLLANVEDVFAPAKKPATVTDDAWRKERANIEVLAHSVLGWVAYSRQENKAAAVEFKTVLELNPVNGQVSYWLGSALLRKAETQGEGLYHIARAAVLDGQGALHPNARIQLQAYLQKVYALYHGDSSGLDELKAVARYSAFPPANFKIQPAADIAK